MLAQGRRGDAVEYFLTVGVGLPKEAVAPMREGPSWQPLEELAHTLPYDIEIMSANVVDAPAAGGGVAVDHGSRARDGRGGEP